MNEITRCTRKSICVTYSDINHRESFVEAVEWTNGEGVDITIDDRKHFSIHHDEWDAMMAAYYALRVR